MPAAIVVSDLRKSYGRIEALRGVSFEVAAASVRPARTEWRRQDDDRRDPRGLPQAGRRQHDGSGHDPARALRGFASARRVLQQSELSPLLTVRDAPNVRGYYSRSGRRRGDRARRPRREARRAGEDAVGWPEERLDLGVALVGNPELVFPTSPRPASTRQLGALRGISSGRCARSERQILLTTHYLDEAQQLSTGSRSCETG